MVYNGKQIIFRKLRESRQGVVCPPEGPSPLNVLILLSLCFLFSQDSNINLTWLNYATYCSCTVLSVPQARFPALGTGIQKAFLTPLS